MWAVKVFSRSSSSKLDHLINASIPQIKRCLSYWYIFFIDLNAGGLIRYPIRMQMPLQSWCTRKCVTMKSRRRQWCPMLSGSVGYRHRSATRKEDRRGSPVGTSWRGRSMHSRTKKIVASVVGSGSMFSIGLTLGLVVQVSSE
jgi:hypothetical protein